MTSTSLVRCQVNGQPVEALVEVRMTLADFLRQELGLTGTHLGCEHGVCGICNVMVDGRATRSCLMLAVQAEGTEIRTVEGLSEGEQLHPIQEAFMEEHGLQCGFCTAGFMMALCELLENNTNPSEDEIKDVLGGQVCRCTGYNSILRAVRSAAGKMSAAGKTGSANA
ncbi:MAG: (2Fe-2S)-binding protein [Myxococcota bacterium]|nr:(2Fe-2S)-binding protein [Myxococcota bacterium]